MDANHVKFYVAKYFFLCLSVLQIILIGAILIQAGFSARTFFLTLLFFILSGTFLLLYFAINNKIRRVAIGKNKIVVIERNRNVRFSWPEVKSVKVLPFFNLYRLKIRGKRSIYFFPSGNTDPAFGLLKGTSRLAELVGKRKRQFR